MLAQDIHRHIVLVTKLLHFHLFRGLGLSIDFTRKRRGQEKGTGEMAKALVETLDRITNRRRGLKGDSSQHLREIANADRIDNTSRATAVCGMQGRWLLHLDGAWMMMGPWGGSWWVARVGKEKWAEMADMMAGRTRRRGGLFVITEGPPPPL